MMQKVNLFKSHTQVTRISNHIYCMTGAPHNHELRLMGACFCLGITQMPNEQCQIDSVVKQAGKTQV